MNKLMWWGYLHANNSIQVKRWLGDHGDYTEDCDGNDLVQRVVPPFEASTREEALRIITERLKMNWKPINELNRRESQLVLVTQDGVVRLHLWNHVRYLWERPFPIGDPILPNDECGQPTHWLPVPDAPA